MRWGVLKFRELNFKWWIRWKKLQHSCPGQLAVPRDKWSSVSPWQVVTVARMPPLVHRQESLAVPQDVGSFSQEPGRTLSVVSKTKVLTYALLTRLITIFLKLKFSSSWVPYHNVHLLKGQQRGTRKKNTSFYCIFVLMCFTHVSFFTNWRQDPAPAERLQLTLWWYLLIVVIWNWTAISPKYPCKMCIKWVDIRCWTWPEQARLLCGIFFCRVYIFLCGVLSRISGLGS